MLIEVIFDTACPWCYIGKRRLERALGMRPGLGVDLRWRPLLLNPHLPTEGVDRDGYLARKFGGSHRLRRVLGAASAAGLAEGIEFDFDAIERTPNTLASHRLISFARRDGCQGAAVEAVFQAYFQRGEDIGDPNVLLRLGTGLGLPEEPLAGRLDREDEDPVLVGDDRRAQRLGVSGVPCFIFDATYAIAGAQEPDVLVRFIDLAHESREEPALTNTR